MSSITPKNVVELRQLLAEKFPGIRMEAGRRESLVERWATGLPSVDLQLEGGLTRGGITEFITSGSGSGASLLLAHLIRRSRHDGLWLALIDGVDSFDPGALENDDLSRLLWVRCRNGREAMRAADLVLHDGTMGIIALDLVSCPVDQLRRIPSSSWHRIARTLEKTPAVCVAFTPDAMIGTAAARLRLLSRFTVESIDADREELVQHMMVQPAAERNEKRFRRERQA